MTTETNIAEYSKTEAELSKLKNTCATTVFDLKTPQGMKQAVSLRAEIRTTRTGIEKLRKEVKAPILALGKLVDSEAERLTNELLALEKPIDEKIKAEEKIKADAKQLEDERKAKVATFFESAKQVVIDCVGKDSKFIKSKGDAFSLIAIDESVFLKQFADANNARENSLDMLGDMILDAEKRELADEQALKIKQAILAKMQVFNITFEERHTLEACAKKRAEVESVVVDALFGELEQKATEEKQDALDYLGKFEMEVTERLEREAKQLAVDFAEKLKAEQEPPEPVNDAVIETVLAMVEKDMPDNPIYDTITIPRAEYDNLQLIKRNCEDAAIRLREDGKWAVDEVIRLLESV